MLKNCAESARLGWKFLLAILLFLMNLHEQNETLVDRLIADGSDLSIEAAEKIKALRTRGKYWERSSHEAHYLLLRKAEEAAIRAKMFLMDHPELRNHYAALASTLARAADDLEVYR